MCCTCCFDKSKKIRVVVFNNFNQVILRVFILKIFLNFKHVFTAQCTNIQYSVLHSVNTSIGQVVITVNEKVSLCIFDHLDTFPDATSWVSCPRSPSGFTVWYSSTAPLAEGHSSDHRGLLLSSCNTSVLLRNTISVDSWASAPPFQYNFLTSSDVNEQLRTHRKQTLH